ncbi:MAG: ATP-binding cassette domain-containing protein [bacterium]|jgi:zinc transport system ATP-binding protein|nr:ATP-binding cassette domain-containing protein [bacterium]HJO25433.1 ATP-binding cassette domain-containing protein [Myxococcota bacterium]
MSIVVLEDCELGPSQKPVLRHVSLSIQSGDFWAIVGPNGSGKTTLVRTVLGLLQPLSGRIEYSDRANFGKHSAYVPQTSNRVETLPTTPREWVRLGLAGLRLSKRERSDRTRDALDQMKLVEIAGRDFSSLSAGLRQRAMVARGLARRAQVIVLDEPSEGLDASSRDILFEALDSHHAGGGTVLLVTHRREEARGRAQRVGRVENGGVRIEGMPP